ncbi:MAG: gliding motility-associated C-terminal domain-containing protein, partial [Bacteroidota bacterium]
SSLCGSAISDTISVYIEPQGTPASIGFDFSACVGSPDLDSMKVLSYSGTLFHWQTSVDSGATWNILPNSDSILYVNFLAGNTIYQLITSHGACPNVNSNTITATVNPVPSVSAGTDTTIYEYNSVQLNGSGGAFGIWTPANFLSDPTLQSPLSTPPQTIIYGYTVIDINGCTNTDYVQVTVLPDSTGFPFIIYNIITPNGDGKNDFLFIKGLNTVDKYLINIFNPNGNLIFQSDDYNNDWGGTYNGQIVPDGTYLYAVEINDLTKYRGFLTIMKGID